MNYFAHTPPKGSKEWHLLRDHLRKTGNLAEGYGRTAIEKELCKIAGQLHDLGKYQVEFQNYLVAQYKSIHHEKVPHAMLGALYANNKNYSEIAFAIAGHHAGIPNISDLKSRMERIKAQSPGRLDEVIKVFESDTGYEIQIKKIELPIDDEYDFDTYTRFIFSALVDADYLDSESHFNNSQSSIRSSKSLDIEVLLNQLDLKFKRFTAKSELNELRTSTRLESLEKANLKPGLFSLVLPTGLGKTLTSTYWGLTHAKHNSLKRIIIVLPYTNIIDQTSKELKEIFGDDLVLEHHSGVSENEDDEFKYDPKKLATENWDYPIIVTTTVQFFESIFSNRPSKCRKIHNIADSVVIFDEVQTLPKESIKPTLRMIRDIQKIFNTSFLFCTATMPAFHKKKGFTFGLENIESLIKDPLTLFKKTNRVGYSFINDLDEIEQDRLIELFRENLHSVLIIFNSKKDALNIFRAINKTEWDEVFHLSTSMCAHHRKSVLEEIKENLSVGKKILTVSTQLVEAGVDFDFPIVYRAIAPLDSIIQAAGRCNREGKLIDENGNPLLGKVFIFKMANMGMPYDSAYKTATEFTITFLKDKIERISTHEIYTEYYSSLMNLFIKEDKANIDESRKNLEFKNVAERYKIIDSPAISVFISEYNSESKDLLNEMNTTKFISQSMYRKMQPYLVQLYPNLFKTAARDNLIKVTEHGIHVWVGGYSKEFGITLEANSYDYVL